jgi:transposase
VSGAIDSLAAAHDAAVQMIDTSIVRVHQHGACITRNQGQSMGRSRGRLTSKIHALVDTNGLPVRLALTPREAHDNRLAGKLLSRLKPGSMLLADRGYDADWIREFAIKKGAWASQHPTKKQSQRSNLLQSASLPSPQSRRALSLTKSNSVVASLRATISSPRTTSRSSSLRQSGCGSALMSPRPNSGLGPREDYDRSIELRIT